MNHRECMTLIMTFSDAYIHAKRKVGTAVTAECQLAVLILILYFLGVLGMKILVLKKAWAESNLYISIKLLLKLSNMSNTNNTSLLTCKYWYIPNFLFQKFCNSICMIITVKVNLLITRSQNYVLENRFLVFINFFSWSIFHFKHLRSIFFAFNFYIFQIAFTIFVFRSPFSSHIHSKSLSIQSLNQLILNSSASL